MKQLQDALRTLSGELLDMAGCQADLAVRLEEEGSGECNGRWKALGDGAGFESRRDPVSPEERNDDPMMSTTAPSKRWVTGGNLQQRRGKGPLREFEVRTRRLELPDDPCEGHRLFCLT